MAHIQGLSKGIGLPHANPTWGPVTVFHPKQNLLLEQLPDAVLQRLLPDLHLVSLVAGQSLAEPGDPCEKILFPVTATIGIAMVLSDGGAIETALIGREGIAGVRALEYATGLHRIYVVDSGLAFSMSRIRLMQEAQTGSAIFRMFWMASIQTLRRISLEMACSHFHPIDQRLAKWVLNRSDLAGAILLKATHQDMANALGVRREAITHAFRKLQGVESRRGYIEIQDSAVLKKMCCECYFLQQEKQAKQLILPFHVPALGPWPI
jgi:CRP-like cAMP-binding protein